MEMPVSQKDQPTHLSINTRNTLSAAVFIPLSPRSWFKETLIY